MEIDEKQKKKKERKKERTTRKNMAHFILMKPEEEGVGVVE